MVMANVFFPQKLVHAWFTSSQAQRAVEKQIVRNMRLLIIAFPIQLQHGREVNRPFLLSDFLSRVLEP